MRHGHDPKMQLLFFNSADIVKLNDGLLGLGKHARHKKR